MSLITKLDSSVEDASLFKIDELLFNVKITEANTKYRLGYQYLSDGVGGEIKIIGNGYFTDSTFTENRGKTATVSDANRKNLYLSAGEYQISFPRKYNLYSLSLGYQESDVGAFQLVGGSMKYTSFGEFSSLAGCNADGSGFSIDQFKVDNAVVLSLSSGNGHYVTGNLSALEGGPVRVLSIASSKVEGDISSLATMTSLEEVYATDATKLAGNLSSVTNKALNLLFLSNTGVEGTVESMLDAIYDSGNGRTSGSIRINVTGTAATYNGSPMLEAKRFYFTAGGWTDVNPNP